MTTFRSEEALVGLIGLGLVPWCAWTILRGLKSGRLPIGRGHVDRHERPAPFAVLLAFYGAAAVFAAFVAVDLLFSMRTAP